MAQEDQIFGEVSFLSGDGHQPAMATIKCVFVRSKQHLRFFKTKNRSMAEGTAVVYMEGNFIEELFTQDIPLALRFYKHMSSKLTARIRDVINPKIPKG